MNRISKRSYLLLMTAALLIGAALRVSGIDLMSDMAHYDEAYYAVDALSLLEQPRFTPFFADNYGRESLWMYWLTPALATFGAQAFSLRVTAFFTGMLALAAVGLLARELLGRRGAVWSVAALGVLFWHVLFSHLAFRALLYPMIGALAFACLWIAWRKNTNRHWIIVGVAFGLLSYTYFAARGWIALALLMLVIGFVIDAHKRRGIVAAVVTSVVISMPLVVYLLTNPAASQRLDQVAISDLNGLIGNIGVWLNVWIGHGADDPMYNLSGRPLLDAPLAIIGVIGMGLLLMRPLTPRPPLPHKWGEGETSAAKLPSPRWRGRGVGGEGVITLFVLALAAVSVAPAVLTTEPLKWLRAIGLVVPLALVLGAGLAGIERAVKRLPHPPTPSPGGEGVKRLAWVIPVALVAWAGVNSGRDFRVWVTSDDLYMPMEQHLYSGIDQIADQYPGAAPVYFAPFTVEHPVLRFREWRLGDRPIGAFKSVDCLPISQVGGIYFGLNVFEPELGAQLNRWYYDVTTAPSPIKYAIYRALGYISNSNGMIFGERIMVSLAEDLPESVRAGETIPIDVALSRAGRVDRAYTVFLHTYPVEEMRLITQMDRPLCPSYPPTLWRGDETVLHSYSLGSPDQAGEYRIALGIYDSETFERLRLDDGTDVVILGTVRVGE